MLIRVEPEQGHGARLVVLYLQWQPPTQVGIPTFSSSPARDSSHHHVVYNIL